MPRALSETEVETFRERLCDVAEELFAKHGPEDVTMRQLASALGVSPMTPYRYFRDRDAILAAVRARAFGRFAAAMNAGKAAARAWSDLGDVYFNFARAHRAAYRLMFDVHQPSADAYPELVEATERARATMGGWLREHAAQGRFDGDVELHAHAIWAVMHGAVMLELAGRLRPPLDARAVAGPALRALLKDMGLWT